MLSLPAPYAEKTHASLISALTTLLSRPKSGNISRSTSTDVTSNEELRMFLIILENPLFLSPSKTTLPLVENLVTAILGLQQNVCLFH